MKRNLFAFISAVPLLFAAVAARAQAPPPSPVPSSSIASIKVNGLQKFPADQVITASGLKVGDVVTADQIQQATNRLAGLGIFSTVTFRYTAKGDAINLEFSVQEAPSYPIVFDNFPWFSDTEIGDAIKKQVGLFTGDSPDGGAVVDRMTAVIESMIDAHKIKGNVEHQLLQAASGDGMVMQFHLDGAPLRVQSVQFGEPLAANSEKLKDRVPDVRGQPYSEYAVDVFENEHVRPIYAAKGYLRAQIGPPQPQLIPDVNDPKQSAVALTIPVTPGPAYSLDRLTIEGNRYVDSAALQGLLDLKLGDVADGTKVEATWRKIEEYYGQHGYLDMKLKADPAFDDATHKVSYRAVISEGAQYRMGEMIITGLSVDAEKRLRQAWSIQPGQIFDNHYYEIHVEMLAKPSRDIFGDLPVHYNQFGHLLRPDTNRHTVDVLLDFK